MTAATPVSTAPTVPAEPVMEVAGAGSRRGAPIGAIVGVGWLALLLFLAIFADFLPFVRYYYDRSSSAANSAFGPGTDYWFGSDQLGRDVFARAIYGARISLLVAVASITVGLLVGGTLGILAGYRRGWIDRVISTSSDILLAFPPVVIAVLIVTRFDALRSQDNGFGWLSRTWSVVIVLSILSIAPVARIVRAQTLSVSQREFVLAARSVGAKGGRILIREVLPNLVPTMISVVFTGMAILLAAEGALAYLGYSVQVPVPTWGSMINEGRPRLREAWWPTLFPCMMMFLTIVAFNLIGDRVARRFDIREATL